MVSMPKFALHNFGTLALALLGLSNLVAAGNTTCAGNLTDWYTNAVGETACTTYQRLRQICNPQYQVPNFRSTTPGDQCDDQLADCCCNSISWALSMLCMNCQWDVLGGSPNGIDAGVGAYGMYRAPNGQFCNPGTNQSLPASIQTAVCNERIKLDNFLYNLFWTNGAWFFVYTMDAANVDQATNNNNTFTHCSSTTLNFTTSLAPGPSGSTITSYISARPTATGNPSASSSHTNTAAVAGGVVGGVGGAALILAVGFFCWRKRRRHQPVPTSEPAMTIAPFSATDSSFSPGHSVQVSSEFVPRHRATYTNLSSSVGPASEAGASQNSSDVMRHPVNEPIREDDMGPLGMLDRSLSGRLPPAYNPQWDESQSPSQSPPQSSRRPLPQPDVATVSSGEAYLRRQEK